MTELASRRRFAYVRGAFQLVFSVALFATTLWFVDVNQLLSRMRRLEPSWTLVALCLFVLQFMLLAARWAFISTRIGIVLPYRRALAEYYLSALLNQVLPGGILGDAVRAVRHARRLKQVEHLRDAGTRAALALLLDRASGQLTIWLAVLVALPAWWQGNALWKAAGGVLLLCATLVVLVRTLWAFSRHWPRFKRFRGLIRESSHLLLDPRHLTPHFALSFALLGVQVIGFWCVARALHYDFGTGAALRIVPGILVASALPAFFAGWGVREAAAASLYYLSGLSAADGATVSVVYGSLGLLSSIPGLFVLISER